MSSQTILALLYFQTQWNEGVGATSVEGHIYMCSLFIHVGKIDKFLACLWVDLPMLWIKRSCKIQEKKNMGLIFEQTLPRLLVFLEKVCTGYGSQFRVDSHTYLPNKELSCPHLAMESEGRYIRSNSRGQL